MPASSTAFVNGMKASANELGDNSKKFEKAFNDRIDMIIIVADDNKKRAQAAAHKIMTETSSFANCLVNQNGNVLKMESGIGIEHFGYADGISQPLYLQEDINHQPSTIEWNDATSLDLLLVRDENAAAPDSFGSYLVFRKLEQNVKGFNKSEDKLPVILDVGGQPNEELAGALLVGRFENSTPVVKKSVDTQPNPPKVTNDFNYKDDLNAQKCPFHAHIRLMNPRNGDKVAGDISAQRITRRGIPYDEIGRIPENKITKITEKMLDDKQPVKGVGLLFMCYQNKIESQFEILQKFWAKGIIKTHDVGSEDSIISQGANRSKTLPAQWGMAKQTKTFTFPNFVTTKGGEYFFTPSINFLKLLNKKK